MVCIICGKPLTGRQRKYCSQTCSSKDYYTKHPARTVKRRDIIDWDLATYQNRHLRLSVAQIGRCFGVSPATIRRGLKERGVYKPVLLKNGKKREDWNSSYKKCDICGNGFSGKSNEIHCEQCRKMSKILRLKIRAFNKLGGPFCHNCGITDFDLLQIGHIFGNGNIHRKELNHLKYPTNMRWWILKASDEEIKKWGVVVECAMCNQFHKYKSKYPTREERKQWAN